MLDKLFSIGASLDWTTPVATFIQDYQNRPSVGYNISVNAGWSAFAVRDLLKTNGVKLWGLTIFGGAITFRTREAQAEFAQYLMDREGIPYQGGICVDRRFSDAANTNTRRMRASSWAVETLIDQIIRMVDG